MKLTCPHCRAQSSLPDNRLPANGAWARCPRCQSRFFITPPAKDQRQANGRQQAPTSTEGPNSLEIITVFPALLGRSPQFYLLSSLVALSILWGGGAYFGLFPGSLRPGTDAALWLAPPRNYEGEILRGDLISLKRSAFHQKALAYTVDSGPAYRIFNHYLPRLAPEQCRKISRVEVESLDPERELTLWGVCLNTNRRGPRLTLTWDGGTAWLKGGPEGPSENLRIFPQAGPGNARETAGQALGINVFEREVYARRSF